jgi:hypothetical protein
MQPKRYAIATIDEMRREMKQAPEFQEGEVNRPQAIQRMAVDLHEMRAKGYSWSAIASWLSERGLQVTPMTLCSYLTKASRDAERRDRRGRAKGKRSSAPDERRRAATLPAAIAPRDGNAAPITPEPRAPFASTVSATLGAKPADAEKMRRSYFEPRPDTKDI